MAKKKKKKRGSPVTPPTRSARPSGRRGAGPESVPARKKKSGRGAPPLKAPASSVAIKRKAADTFEKKMRRLAMDALDKVGTPAPGGASKSEKRAAELRAAGALGSRRAGQSARRILEQSERSAASRKSKLIGFSASEARRVARKRKKKR